MFFSLAIYETPILKKFVVSIRVGRNNFIVSFYILWDIFDSRSWNKHVTHIGLFIELQTTEN